MKERTHKSSYLIEKGSLDEQIVADFYEDGHGIDRTWKVVNRRRKEVGEVLVGRSCIVECLKWLKMKVIRVKKISQGLSDPRSEWAQAGFNQA